MAFSPGTTLRWLASATLSSAVAMVAVGEFLLKDRLHAEAFIYYWMVCIAFTFLTLMLALADCWLVCRQMHRRQRELLAEALEAVAQAGVRIEEQEWGKRDF